MPVRQVTPEPAVEAEDPVAEFARLSKVLEDHRALREQRIRQAAKFEATRLRISRDLSDLGLVDDPDATRILAELLGRIRPKPVPDELTAEARRLNELASVLAQLRRRDDA